MQIRVPTEHLFLNFPYVTIFKIRHDSQKRLSPQEVVVPWDALLDVGKQVCMLWYLHIIIHGNKCTPNGFWICRLNTNCFCGWWSMLISKPRNTQLAIILQVLTRYSYVKQRDFSQVYVNNKINKVQQWSKGYKNCPLDKNW